MTQSSWNKFLKFLVSIFTIPPAVYKHRRLSYIARNKSTFAKIHEIHTGIQRTLDIILTTYFISQI